MPGAYWTDPTTGQLTSTPPAGAGSDSGLSGQAAKQNLAAAPDLESLSNLINSINQQANQGRVPGGAALEAQSSQNIANELAGNLPQSFLDTLRTGIAQRGGASGFGADSPNLNAAALRGMGIESSTRQAQGQTDLNAAYNRAAPLWDVSQGMITPALLQQQQDAAAGRSLQQQQINNQAAQAAQSLAEQQREFGSTLQQNKDSLAAQMGLSYAQLGEKTKEFVDSQAQQLQEQQSSLAENARQANMQNAYQMAQMQTQMGQYNQNYQLALQKQQADIAAQQYAQQTQAQQFNYSTAPWYASAGNAPSGYSPPTGYNPLQSVNANIGRVNPF